MNGIVQRVRVDVGRRTIGELAQEREAAAIEIERLRYELGEAKSAPTHPTSTHIQQAKPSIQNTRSEIAWNSRALLRLSEVCQIVGFSRSSIYKSVSVGSFPKPMRIGASAVRWRSEDIVAWLQRR